MTMNREEKCEMKSRLGQFINFANGRFTDNEIEYLASIVDNRDEYNGTLRMYHNSYKTVDLEDILGQ